jgi:MFS family permease
MTQGSAAKDAPPPFTDEELQALGLGDPNVLAYVGEHLPELRRWVSGHHFLYWSLGIGFVVGLAAHVGGYLLVTSVTTEPFKVLADLLYALGWAMWTGVVVVVFVQVIPEIKQRQIKRWLDAYQATLRDQARAGSDQASGDDGAPTAR